MPEVIEACNNEICIKKEQCKRYKLFIQGQTFVKRFGGKVHKGCRQFIKIEKR